ncbi:uncharacterized protein LOC126858689, partial [Cataglyphis hispanica]|uniref:uncharacterized protein LOC126858689 n=1 Tax=Cataglyphis hispanica TaxID=1086592 RepID=UPI002180561D
SQHRNAENPSPGPSRDRKVDSGISQAVIRKSGIDHRSEGRKIQTIVRRSKIHQRSSSSKASKASRNREIRKIGVGIRDPKKFRISRSENPESGIRHQTSALYRIIKDQKHRRQRHQKSDSSRSRRDQNPSRRHQNRHDPIENPRQIVESAFIEIDQQSHPARSIENRETSSILASIKFNHFDPALDRRRRYRRHPSRSVSEIVAIIDRHQDIVENRIQTSEISIKLASESIVRYRKDPESKSKIREMKVEISKSSLLRPRSDRNKASRLSEVNQDSKEQSEDLSESRLKSDQSQIRQSSNQRPKWRSKNLGNVRISKNSESMSDRDRGKA